MESEVASSMKIALTLTIIGTLIFTILVLINVVKPSIFDKINWVVNATDAEKLRQYEDYDQKWVSGTKVLRVLKLYEDTGFGIVYGTKDTQLPENNYALNFGGVLQGASGLPNETSPSEYRITDFTSWKIKNNASDTFYTKSFRMKADNNVLRFENKSVTRHLKAALGYIQPDGRFYAELIKDITGEIVGICFTQD